MANCKRLEKVKKKRELDAKRREEMVKRDEEAKKSRNIWVKR